MNVDSFDFKVNDPIIREDKFGEKRGLYRETYADKTGIRVRFADNAKGTSGAIYSASIDEVYPA